MKKQIKGKIFNLKGKTYNTKDFKRIESKVLFLDVAELDAENPLIPSIDRTIIGISIKLIGIKGDNKFVKYSEEELERFQDEADKADKKLKEFWKKFK